MIQRKSETSDPNLVEEVDDYLREAYDTLNPQMQQLTMQPVVFSIIEKLESL
jgi:hypothetical protein